MNLVTPAFVDQVLYHKMQSLGLKGSPYLNPVLRELVDCRYYFLGEQVVEYFEAVTLIQGMQEQLNNLKEKLAFLKATGNATEEEVLAAMAGTMGIEMEIEDGS